MTSAADKDSLFQRFIRQQKRWSYGFDRLLPRKFTTDGNRDFVEQLMPKMVKPGQRIYDVGGGKHPCFSLSTKRALNLELIGLDISLEELKSAPPGVYDRIICADIQNFQGAEDGDAAICQALLEHVQDTSKAFLSLSSIVKPGGLVLLFVPSRHALFARINLVLPQSLKRRMLVALFPTSEAKQGFRSFYNRCTPTEFRRLASEHGFEVIEARFYYKSDYFFFLFPLYILWRLWSMAACLLFREQSAETFAMVLLRRS